MFRQSQLIIPISAEHKFTSKGSLAAFEKLEDMRANGSDGDGAAQNRSTSGVKRNVGDELSFQTGSSAVQRYLPAGWCALLCKIKHQHIVRWDTINQNQNALFEAKQGETVRTEQINLSCNKIIVSAQSPSLANQWKPYLRPILPPSRSNLWRRKGEFLVERNQLP